MAPDVDEFPQPFPEESKGLTSDTLPSARPDLILVNCVHREVNGTISQSPQLGLLYIASNAKQAGYSVAVVAGDAVLRDIARGCGDGLPLLAGFYVNSDNYQDAVRVARILKSRFEWIRTIAGGPVANVQDVELVECRAFDFACRGDGEELVLELLSHLTLSFPSLSSILGLTYRTGDQLVNQNAPRPLIRDLDRFPIPDRVLYPLETSELRSQIITSRGCGFRCTFCYESTNRRLRTHSPERVVEEMRYLKEHYGTTYFTFVDDIFTQAPARVREICRLLVRSFRPHKDLFWYCEARVDQLARNRDLLPLMKEAGLVRLQIGTESGSQDVIDAYKKRITIDQVVDVVAQCVEADVLSVHTNFILGGAHETPETFAKTMELARTLVSLAPGRFEATTTYLSPYPGTDIAVNPQNYRVCIVDPEFRTGLSDDYIFAETEALRKEDILRLGIAFRAELTAEMMKYMSRIPGDLLMQHVTMTEHDLLTQWAELTLSDPVLAAWARFRRTGLYHEDFGDQPFCNVFPQRTFDLGNVIADGGRMLWAMMGRKYEFQPTEVKILELCSGKNSLEEVVKIGAILLEPGAAFIKSLAQHKLVVFRYDPGDTVFHRLADCS